MRTDIEKETRMVKFAKWLESHWLYLLDWLTPILLSILFLFLGFYFDGINKLTITPVLWLIIITAVLIIFYIYIKIQLIKEKDNLEIYKTKVADLRAERNDLQELSFFFNAKLNNLNQGYTSDYLSEILKVTMGISDHVRVSLYAHHEDSFILAGRFTQHPEHIKHRRERFSSDQGCIGKAWKDGGSYFCNDLPDPVNDEQLYFERLKEDFNIDKKDSRQLRMKSRSYYAKAIAKNTRRVGVIVFESTQCDILDKELLEKEVVSREERLVGITEDAIELSPFKELGNGTA